MEKVAVANNEMELMGNPKTFPRVPEGRTYIHSRCSAGTTISGHDFVRLCHPGGRTPTICAKCRRAFPLKEFRWSDTGENVTDYLDRLKTMLPPAYTEAKSKTMRVAGFCAALGAVLGILIGVAVEHSVPSGIGGFFVGMFVGFIGGAIAGNKMFPAFIEFRKYV